MVGKNKISAKFIAPALICLVILSSLNPVAASGEASGNSDVEEVLINKLYGISDTLHLLGSLECADDWDGDIFSIRQKHKEEIQYLVQTNTPAFLRRFVFEYCEMNDLDNTRQIPRDTLVKATRFYLIYWWLYNASFYRWKYSQLYYNDITTWFLEALSHITGLLTGLDGLPAASQNLAKEIIGISSDQKVAAGFAQALETVWEKYDDWYDPDDPPPEVEEMNSAISNYISELIENLPESPFWLFDDTLPTIPTPISPRDIVAEGQSFEFIWFPSFDVGSGVDYYEFQLDNNSDFTSPYSEDSSTISATVSISDEYMTTDGTHYWRVKAIDKAGNSSQWSEKSQVVLDVPPRPPTVYSPTHPLPEEYYLNHDVMLEWLEPYDLFGIEGYSYTFNNDNDTIPEEDIVTTENSISFENKPNGVWYFHIRAVDNAGNWGETAHLRVWIDSEASPEVDLPLVTIARGTQANPAVAAGDDEFFVVWNDRNTRIAGKIYDLEGNVVKQEFTIAASPEVRSPTIAFDDGNFLVVWEDARSWSNQGTNWHKRAAIHDSFGGIVAPDSPWGDEKPSVFTYIPENISPYMLNTAGGISGDITGGEFLVVWGSGDNIFGTTQPLSSEVTEVDSMPPPGPLSGGGGHEENLQCSSWHQSLN